MDVAITVDDLPVHGPLPPGRTRLSVARDLLDAFKAHGIPPVYGFVNGKKVADEPETLVVLRAWASSGNPLANHTWSHQSLNALTPEEYVEDIRKNEPLLASLVSDSRNWHYFRYPFLHEGDTQVKRRTVRQFLSDSEYTVADVSIDGNDWAFNAPFDRCLARGDEVQTLALRDEFVEVHLTELRNARTVGKRLTGREISHVLLLHAGVASAESIDGLLTAYEREGVRWITLPAALSDPFYAMGAGVPVKDGPAFPYRIAKARGVDMPESDSSAELRERLEVICR